MNDRWAVASSVASVGATLATVYALKLHYSTATADDLWWILGPTTALVETLSSHDFVLEPRAGFVSRELSTVIAPSCAGVNYMIAACCVLVLAFVHQLRSGWRKGLWLLASACVAYVATVVVNAVRVLVAIGLKDAPPTAALTAAEIHRIEGVVIYLVSLFFLYLCGQSLLERRGA